MCSANRHGQVPQDESVSFSEPTEGGSAGAGGADGGGSREPAHEITATAGVGHEKTYALTCALRKYWGHATFRPLQREAMEATLSGRDCLLVLPTGAGKSIAFQLPAVLQQGVTLVVSPLIALATEQVAELTDRGIEAAALNSSIALDDRVRLEEDLLSSDPTTKLLYVAPESLVSGSRAFATLREALWRGVISCVA